MVILLERERATADQPSQLHATDPGQRPHEDVGGPPLPGQGDVVAHAGIDLAQVDPAVPGLTGQQHDAARPDDPRDLRQRAVQLIVIKVGCSWLVPRISRA